MLTLSRKIFSKQLVLSTLGKKKFCIFSETNLTEVVMAYSVATQHTADYNVPLECNS